MSVSLKRLSWITVMQTPDTSGRDANWDTKVHLPSVDVYVGKHTAGTLIFNSPESLISSELIWNECGSREIVP